MKLRAILHVAASAALLMTCVAGFSPAAAGQDLRQDLKKFVETPAIPGYEQVLAKEIQKELAQWKRQIDTIGNVVVTIGSGAPHRAIVTPMDEPGYIVSNITAGGFLVRAVDNSNITPREYADRVVKLAKANNIPVQLGITGGGNDGSVFLPYGTIDIGLGWPLRYSHSRGEVIDTRDLDGLAKILAVLAKSW